MYKLVFILSLVFIGLSSCKKETQSAKTQAEFIAELESTPTTIGIGDHVFSLNVELIRNFMPVCEENGDPMYCVVELTEINHPEEENTAVLKRIYAIQGNELWTGIVTPRNLGVAAISGGMSIGGPKWIPNTLADVVCEFEFQGITRRIIVKSRPVLAVY